MPSDGFPMKFYDGIIRKVRVHLIYISRDQPAVSKLIQGVYYRTTGGGGHYYYPPTVRENETGETKRLFDIRNLPHRATQQTTETIGKLSSANSTERARIRNETGIRSGSIFFTLPLADPHRIASGFGPYAFFPHDVMHLFYNIQRELICLWLSMPNESFFLQQRVVEEVDVEPTNWGYSISGQLTPKPRLISDFRRWKAADHKAFSLNFALIILDRVFSEQDLNGLELLVKVIDISFRTAVRDTDVQTLCDIATKYFDHFEQKYYR